MTGVNILRKQRMAIMADPDLTAPEAVERLVQHYDNANDHLPNPSENLTAVTLRALSAEREALITARDMMGRLWEKEKARAEASDAKLKEAVAVLRHVVEEYGEFRKDEYDRGVAPLDDEIYEARAFLASLEGDKP